MAVIVIGSETYIEYPTEESFRAASLSTLLCWLDFANRRIGRALEDEVLEERIVEHARMSALGARQLARAREATIRAKFARSS